MITKIHFKPLKICSLVFLEEFKKLVSICYYIKVFEISYFSSFPRYHLSMILIFPPVILSPFSLSNNNANLQIFQKSMSSMIITSISKGHTGTTNKV